MALCGETLCGMDTDEVFGYSTQKMVWIRDRWIGFLYYSLVGMVLLWVLGDQILWKNEHFMLKDVQGMPRMWLSHPTVDNCEPGTTGCKSSFRQLINLPYCDVYNGSENSTQRAHCEFKDRISLQDSGSRVQSVFIPTAVELVTERKKCFPSEENGYTCDNVYETVGGSDCLQEGYLCKRRGNLTNQFYYVADINNFLIRFTSSYERGDIRGTSLMHPGYMGVCNRLVSLANTTQTWTKRKENAKYKCTDQELEMVKLPCKGHGSNCAQVRDFDRLEDQGVGAAGRHLQKVFSKHISDHLGVSGQDPTDLLGLEAQEALAQVGAKPHRHGESPTQRGLHLEVDDSQQTGHLRPDQKQRHQRGRGTSSLAEHSSLLATLTGEDPESPPPADFGTGDMFSDNWGDVFKIRALLELAGANLDRNFNMDGWSARQAGTVLEVKAVYNNMHHLISSFGYSPVSYHYSVRQLTIPYVSRVKLSSDQPADYPNTRNYEVQYGLLIYFKVAGTFGFFNLVYLIVMLTAAFALTSTATTVTDFVGLYIHPRRQNYFHLKYEVSPDFSDTWECSTCGYHNLDHVQECQGRARWVSQVDTPACAAPRPEESKA